MVYGRTDPEVLVSDGQMWCGGFVCIFPVLGTCVFDPPFIKLKLQAFENVWIVLAYGMSAVHVLLKIFLDGYRKFRKVIIGELYR